LIVGCPRAIKQEDEVETAASRGSIFHLNCGTDSARPAEFGTYFKTLPQVPNISAEA
jgi:hypothetical protein